MDTENFSLQNNYDCFDVLATVSNEGGYYCYTGPSPGNEGKEVSIKRKKYSTIQHKWTNRAQFIVPNSDPRFSNKGGGCSDRNSEHRKI